MLDVVDGSRHLSEEPFAKDWGISTLFISQFVAEQTDQYTSRSSKSRVLEALRAN